MRDENEIMEDIADALFKINENLEALATGVNCTLEEILGTSEDSVDVLSGIRRELREIYRRIP